jgi:hypothetical protein
LFTNDMLVKEKIWNFILSFFSKKKSSRLYICFHIAIFFLKGSHVGWYWSLVIIGVFYRCQNYRWKIALLLQSWWKWSFYNIQLGGSFCTF